MVTVSEVKVEHSNGTYAKVIADSISQAGHRLTTFEVRFHRFVLAEFNTHRLFSRNSASSRAIPVGKNLDEVYFNTAIPVEWRSEKSGMQGGDLLSEEDAKQAEAIWIKASVDAGLRAEELMDLGVHKSIVNRLLEPFMWHTVIVTATAWDNFFAQRVSPLAQPEIKAAARMMLDAYEASDPRLVYDTEYHRPYITPEDEDAVNDKYADSDGMVSWENDLKVTDELNRISVARCARVSYLTHDGKRDLQADLDLYDRLVSADPMHASPLEHVATPDPRNAQSESIPVGEGRSQSRLLPRIGNFVGWRQLRYDVEVEKGLNSYG